MKTIESLTNTLLDIEMPLAPPDASVYTTSILVIIASATIILLAYFFIYRSDFKHRRSLSKLKQRLLLSEISPKTACYQLADLLKSIHKTQQLTVKTMDSPCSGKQWEDFILRLSAYRYQSRGIDKAKTIQLIDESKSWLRVAGYD